MGIQAFSPKRGGGQNVNTSGTSAAVEIGAGEQSLLITNTGQNPAHVRVGDSTVVATTADLIVGGNSRICITKFQDDTHVAHLQVTGTTTLNFMPGQGIAY